MGFGLGPMEMVVVMVIAVLLFGKNLPQVGKTLGKGIVEFKKGLNDIKNEVESATNVTQSSTARTSQPRSNADDYDEPTAPKFEPPTGEPT